MRNERQPEAPGLVRPTIEQADIATQHGVQEGVEPRRARVPLLPDHRDPRPGDGRAAWPRDPAFDPGELPQRDLRGRRVGGRGLSGAAGVCS